MLQLFNSNNPVQQNISTMTIVVSLLLMAIPFTVGAQEQESDIDRAVIEERLASCVYEWDCFDVVDFQKETVLVNLSAVLIYDSETNCRGDEPGFGWVTLSTRKGSAQSAAFGIQGLELVWVFGNGEPESYMFTIHPDGNGLYYDFSYVKADEFVKPSQIYKCVDRSDEAVDRMIKTLGF